MDKMRVETGSPLGSPSEASSWATLYKAGAVAPLITLFIYMIQLLVIMFGETYPTTIIEWFALFQRNKILGLFYINAFDIFSIALLGIMFLALYIALRRYNESLMLIATFLALLGIVVFVSTRAELVSAMISLSDQYTTAAEAVRDQLLAAGQAINSLGRATPETTGFLFMAIAGLIISIVILQNGTFSRWTTYVGFLGCALTVGNQLSLVLAPEIAAILMPVNGVLWLIWWLLVSRGLFKLGRNTS
jgi:uncharacterized membrane protein YgdD (TMEM256/DUF423 family)